MKIVKPFDWQIIRSSDLDIIVDDVDMEDLECVLWLKETYFAAPANPYPALARAPIVLFSKYVGHARFSDLKPWQSCIIGVVKKDTQKIYAAVGVIFGHSSFTDWLRKTSTIPTADIIDYIRYPMSIASFTLSHYGAAVDTEIEYSKDMVEFIHSWDASVRPTFIVISESELIDAAYSLLNIYCIGIDNKRFSHLLSQSPYRSCPIYVARFPHALIISPTGLVIFDENNIWSDSSFAAFFNDSGLHHHKHLFRARGEVGLLLDEVRSLADIFADNQVADLPGVPMPICHAVYHNHGHWIANSLFAAYLLRDQIREGNIFLLVPEHSSYILDSLSSIGIHQSSILIVKPSTYRLNNVIFPSTISILSNTFPHSEMFHMFSMIRDSVSMVSKKTGPQRIYITRKGSATQRRISNEDDLILGLRMRGFACVAPHELEFLEEVSFFSNAQFIIGQLGAGLANIGFAPPGCVVIEITSNNYTSNDYWFLSHILGHKFIRFLFESELDDEFTLHDFEFEVPTETALAMVDKIIEDRFI